MFTASEDFFINNLQGIYDAIGWLGITGLLVFEKATGRQSGTDALYQVPDSNLDWCLSLEIVAETPRDAQLKFDNWWLIPQV